MSAPREGSAGPSGTVRGCDTADMLVIHGMFRRLFTDLPALVAGVPVGDSVRSAVVGAHVREVSAGLHAHHQGEDLLLWEKLESRAPACALHVGQMRAQHQAVALELGELENAVELWQTTNAVEDAESVVDILTTIKALLFAHLGQEERQILPVAGVTLTQQEWDLLGAHGRTAIPRERLMVQLGFILEGFAPDERAGWLRENVPAPIRLLYRVIGRRQYEKNYRLVYGAAPL
nr:hemerythrin domain-containing protein [Leifsonia psychrotolerans]